jgi:hypothetical protein
MKHLKLVQKVALAALVIFTAAGCIKNHDDIPAPAISGLAFVNASPDAPSVNINVDNRQVNSDSFPFKSHIDYVNAFSGTREVTAFEGGTKKTTANITLEEGRLYSLFLAGPWASSEFVLLEDSLSRPESGKAHIRFLNMSVGAPSLDLLSGGTALVANKAYKANSGYINVDGDKQYNFTIREHGQSADKVTLSAITIQAGYNYTIWANGVYTQTGAGGFGGDVIKNY